VRVEAADLTFADCSAVRVLVQAAKAHECAGGSLCVANARGPLRRILEIFESSLLLRPSDR
jgi:anti-anti-sigma factor